MNFSSLTALSPSTAATRPSSHRRVQVEVEWFIAPSDAGFAEFKPLSEAARGLLRGLVVRFSEADAQAIKDIEKTTNHDVKAVEYWLKSHFDGHAELKGAGEFVHFACTSEDINNTAHALMLDAARRQVLLPALDGVVDKLRGMAHAFADVPMLSSTHGQTASRVLPLMRCAAHVADRGAPRDRQNPRRPAAESQQLVVAALFGWWLHRAACWRPCCPPTGSWR